MKISVPESFGSKQVQGCPTAVATTTSIGSTTTEEYEKREEEKKHKQRDEEEQEQKKRRVDIDILAIELMVDNIKHNDDETRFMLRTYCDMGYLSYVADLKSYAFEDHLSVDEAEALYKQSKPDLEKRKERLKLEVEAYNNKLQEYHELINKAKEALARNS